MNNFSSNAIITFCNGIPSKSVQDEIYEKLNQQYCGTENTSKIFVNYADNIENAPKIERLESDNFGDLYNQLITNSIDDVYQACRINPALLGKNVQTGFSKQEFLEISELFQKTVINPMQALLSKSYKEIGINVNLKNLLLNNED